MREGARLLIQVMCRTSWRNTGKYLWVYILRESPPISGSVQRGKYGYSHIREYGNDDAPIRRSSRGV